MSRWQNKYVIGLTGNIAVGKSVVRQMLQHLGAYTIDADGLGHQAMMPGAPAYKPVVDTFGQFIVGSDGRINRSMLASMVFSNPQALHKLEQITHPIIRQAINALVSRSKQRVVVIEAIKLLEGELAEMVDVVWVVDAKPETQYKRLVEKRKLPPDDAKQRITAQGAQADKLAKANVVINNDSNVEETWKQVQAQWNEIKRALVGGTKPDVAQPGSHQPAAGTTLTAVAEPVEEAAPAASQTSGDLVVKRGMPGIAQQIADFIKAVSGRDVDRMDIMMSFGQKSYLVIEDKAEKVVSVMGWTVENLVTRMDEFYIDPGADTPEVVQTMILAIEDASKELQSEVGFIFLPTDTDPAVIKALNAQNYQSITLKEIKIPAWREAVEEMVAENEVQVLWKQLRKDRVLQPI